MEQEIGRRTCQWKKCWPFWPDRSTTFAARIRGAGPQARFPIGIGLAIAMNGARNWAANMSVEKVLALLAGPINDFRGANPRSRAAGPISDRDRVGYCDEWSKKLGGEHVSGKSVGPFGRTDQRLSRRESAEQGRRPDFRSGSGWLLR